MNRSQILISLSLANGIGPALVNKLISHITALPTATISDLVTFGCSQKQAVAVHAALRDRATYARHDQWLAQSTARVVSIYDDEYPTLLTHTACPPPILWVQGAALPATYHGCALVGSRAAGPPALRAIKKLIPTLISNQIITISGGALGVDGWVHQQTVEHGGHTVVVAGCGLQHTYPRSHHTLFQTVLAHGGTIISPFAPWVAPSRGTFPARNRIIAGLSQVCVVVQAAQRSGALITAGYALAENRDVAALPGPIDDPLCEGSNRLLAQGAHVVTGAQSILPLFGIAHNASGNTAPATNLSDEEQAILELLREPATIDDLVAAGHTDASHLQELLFSLQAHGKISQNHAGFWERHE